MTDGAIAILAKLAGIAEWQSPRVTGDAAEMLLDCFQSRHRFSLPLFCGRSLVMLPFLLYVQYIIRIG